MFIRAVGFTVLVVEVLVLVLVLFSEADWGEAAAIPLPSATNTSLRVGAFNIRTFGKTKMSDDIVAGRIKQIVERYDVLLIQEIRDKSVDSVRKLLGMLQRPFNFVISEPIGRSSYKEQYAYFYRSDRILLLDTYQYEDPEDVFEREPYVVKIAPMFANHDTVSLIGLHAKPSDATAEIGHLRDVINKTLEEMGHDSEPIILGDLNADCSYADLDARLEAHDYLTVNTNTYTWLIGDDTDTTTKTTTDCAYDRIIVRSPLQTHVVSNSSIAFDYVHWLGLTEDEALDVSDHYPVEMILSF